MLSSKPVKKNSGPDIIRNNMATRSFIGIQNGNGSVTGVYCHFDGYLDGVGSILKESYTDPTKIRRLVELGALSSLGREIGERHDFDARRYGEIIDATTAYHRDRGEELSIREYPSPASIKFEDGGYEYIYVYTKDGWTYRTSGGAETFQPVP
jgi:hypothetical protein